MFKAPEYTYQDFAMFRDFTAHVGLHLQVFIAKLEGLEHVEAGVARDRILLACEELKPALDFEPRPFPLYYGRQLNDLAYCIEALAGDAHRAVQCRKMRDWMAVDLMDATTFITYAPVLRAIANCIIEGWTHTQAYLIVKKHDRREIASSLDALKDTRYREAVREELQLFIEAMYYMKMAGTDEAACGRLNKAGALLLEAMARSRAPRSSHLFSELVAFEKRLAALKNLTLDEKKVKHLSRLLGVDAMSKQIYHAFSAAMRKRAATILRKWNILDGIDPDEGLYPEERLRKQVEEYDD